MVNFFFDHPISTSSFHSVDSPAASNEDSEEDGVLTHLSLGPPIPSTTPLPSLESEQPPWTADDVASPPLVPTNPSWADRSQPPQEFDPYIPETTTNTYTRIPSRSASQKRTLEGNTSSSTNAIGKKQKTKTDGHTPRSNAPKNSKK